MSKLNRVLPHGKIKKIFDDIWFVKGQVKMPMFLPIKVSKSMTIIRNPGSNELTLVNAMPLNEEGLKELQSLGVITNTLRIGGYHGRDDNFYKEKFGAKVYALKGHIYAKKFDGAEDISKSYFKADILLDEKSELPIVNASLKIFKTSTPVEAILCIKNHGGLLITADSLQNTDAPDEFCNLVAKVVMRKMNFFKAYNIGPGWVNFAKPSKTDIQSILELDFQNVLPGHGNPVLGGAKEKFKPSIDGLSIG